MDLVPKTSSDPGRTSVVRGDPRYPQAYLRGTRLLQAIRTVAGIAAGVTLLPFFLFLEIMWDAGGPSQLSWWDRGLALVVSILLGLLVTFWAGVAYALKHWTERKRAGWVVAVGISVFLIVTGIAPLAAIYAGEVLHLFIDVRSCFSHGGDKFLCHREGYSLDELIEWSVFIPLCVLWGASWVSGWWLLSCSLNGDTRFVFSEAFRPPSGPEIRSHHDP